MRDEAWQIAYLHTLANIVENMLENAENIPDYLASGVVPAAHLPIDLLPLVRSKKVLIEKMKSLILSQTNYESYLTKIPEGTKFLRFAKLPKTIVC